MKVEGDLMKTLNFLGLFLICLVLITACTVPIQPTSPSSPTSLPPTSSLIPTPSSTPTGDELPPYISAVQKFAMDRLDAKPGEVKIIKTEAVDWPDACLGAAQAGEMCAQVITPGYKLEVMIKGKTYILHTDAGQFVRMPTPVLTGMETSPAADAARLWLMDTLKLDINGIRVVSVAPQTWPDGCMGVRKPDAVCSGVIIPGYQVILEARGATYEVRTSQDGKKIVLADPKFQVLNPKGTSLERPQITWQSGGNNCFMLQAFEDQAAFGLCGGSLKITKLPSPNRIKELVALMQLYQPFSAQTQAGEVAFYGRGASAATLSQQRAVAEWAYMVYLDISSSSPPANTGLALIWKREGGIAGFCDDLKVFRSGLAVITSCKTGADRPQDTLWLNAAQLDQFFGWLDTLQTSDGRQIDPAVTDQMRITWMLSANGRRTPNESERQAIQTFAAEVFSGRPVQ
jgi:hypothetical protein